jgi:antitoxin component HigA of HigAB toxin-antitoxin module
VITAIAEKKEYTKSQPKGVYYIATFSYKMADVEQTKELQQFAQEAKIFRQETLTDIANIKTAMNYYNPFANIAEETALLPAGQA